jgi:hypothetical protein
MNAAIPAIIERVHDRVYDGVGIAGVYEWGSGHLQEKCANVMRRSRRLHQLLAVYTLHLISPLSTVSIPLPRIVLRLRAPSSCSDLFAESQDEGGARRGETIDRYSSLEPSQVNGATVSIPVPRIVLRLRAPSSCPDLFAESLDEGGARRRETIDRYSSSDPSRENV